MNEKIYMVPNPPTPSNGMSFNPDICNGCNLCVDVCPDDVFMPNPKKGKPPIVLYAEECWFCGGCIEECHRPGAITMRHPTAQNISVNWKRKETGEYFRLHQKNPPPADMRPPSG